MAAKYDAADIEVLSGLDPVRKRPGMYTDTSRPNHLAQEVVDNSVDEAIVGHAKKIEVIVHKDGSLSVQDDGRGLNYEAITSKGRRLGLIGLRQAAKASAAVPIRSRKLAR